MKNRPLRLFFWFASVTIMSLVAGFTAWFWNQGMMVDHGMQRTIAWAAVGVFLFLFLYPKKRH